MVDEQEKQLEQVIENKTKNKEKLFRIVGSIVSVVVLIILIIIKTNKPDFPLFWFIGGIIFIIVFFISFFWGFTIYRKYQEATSSKLEEGKLPPAISLEQARELIRQLLVRPEYSDYEVGWKNHKVFTVGEQVKSRVLLVHLSPTPYSSDPFQFIVLNLHMPRELWSYISQKKYNMGELMRAVNAAGIDPNPEPDVEKRVETNLSTGVQTEYLKRSKHEKIEREKTKEDLT